MVSVACMSWKVLVTARAFEGATESEGWRMLEAAGCELVTTPLDLPLDHGELRELLAGLDALVAGSDDFSEATLRLPEASDLKFISRWGVGYDSIDVRVATEFGIVVGYLPGYLDQAVADFAWALLLGVARGVTTGHGKVMAGEWETVWGHDVHHKTLGIIGCGRIGREVARRASGFQMRVLGYDPVPTEAARELGVEFVSLKELLAESDFISLNAAATKANRNLIDEGALRQMKRTACLVNTGRGSLMDEVALARALREGWVGGVGLDAFVTEPLPVNHPLRSAPNILLTPHMAPMAHGTRAEVNVAVAQSILDLMAGNRPKLLVNPEVFETPSLRVVMQGGR